MKVKNIVLLFIVFICALFSMYFSMRAYNTPVAWDRNDTSNYYWYFNCLVNDNPYLFCNVNLGMNWFESILAFFSLLSGVITGEHYLMFFITSFLFFISLIMFYKSLGIHALLVIPLVALSSSFWEFELNIIRNSLSVSFFLLSLSYNNRRMIFLVLGMFSHTSGIMYFLIDKASKFLNEKYLLILLTLLLILPVNITDIFIIILQKIPLINSTTIVSKLTAYSAIFESDLSLVNIIGKVYLLATYLIYFLIRSNDDNGKGKKIYKILLLILIIGCVLETTSVVYRVINIYLFFIFYFAIYGVRVKSKLGYFLYFICLSWSIYNFYLKGDFYMRFLQ